MKKLVIAIALSATTAAMAAEPEIATGNTAFDTAVEDIVSASPALQASRSRIAGVMMQRNAANRLASPEVEVEYLFSTNKADATDKLNVGVSQEFDWIGAYKARRRSNDIATQLDEARLRVAEREYARDASCLIVDIVAARQRYDNMKRVADEYANLRSVYEDEYAKGNVSILDLNKIRIEAADYASQVAELLLELDDMHTRASYLTSDKTTRLVDNVTEFPIIPLETLTYYEQQLEQSPSGEMMALSARLAHANVDVARQEGLPGFSIGYKYAREEHINFHGFTVGVALPIWGGANLSRRSALAEATAVESENDGTRSALETNLYNNYNNALNLSAQIDSFTQALVASDNLGLLHQAFEGGQITLSQYIQDVAYFVNADQRLIDLRRQYFHALIQLKYL